MPIPKDIITVNVSDQIVPPDEHWWPVETFMYGPPRREISKAVVVFNKEQACSAGAILGPGFSFICVDFPRSLLATSVYDCVRFFDEGKA